MRSSSFLRVLRSTVAVGAIALASGAANAACTTANGVVTCSDVNTSDQVNTQVNNAPPPSVTLNITQGAIVARGFASSIGPNGSRFPGAIGYNNSGTVGTTGANVDFTYFGNSVFNGQAIPTNTFTFDNRGMQNGGIFAFNVGGAITGTNSGTVTRGIDLRTAGAINFTNTGSVFNTSGFPGGPAAITLISSVNTSQTGADGITRTIESGGPITATINGTVGIPAGPTRAFQPQGVFARSVGGVDMTVNGTTGFVSAQSGGTATDRRSTSVRSGTTDTFTQIDDSRSIGGNARITIGTAGRVGDVFVNAGPGAATAVVNGNVDGIVNVSANGVDRVSRSSNSFSNTTFTSSGTSSGSSTSTGGAALADISSTGRVAGNVTVSSNAGAATVRIAGQVGTPTNMFASVSATSSGTNSAFESRSANRGDGTSDSSSSSTASLSGGAASVTLAATGNVLGNVSAFGDGSATVDNAGRVGGSIFATSGTTLTTAEANSSSRTITNTAGGGSTEVQRGSNNSTRETLGGVASVTNRADATVGSVQVSGVAGATLNNAGSIANNAFVNSSGSRTVSASSAQNTTTRVPTAGGGLAFTFSGENSGSGSTRNAGGAALADVSATGRIGGSLNVFSNAGTATARVAGQVGTTSNPFGGVFVNSSGTNSTFENRSVNQPDGSSEATNSSTASLSGGAALATVATTGVVNGDVSARGDASAVVDNAGRISGNVFANSGTFLTTAAASRSTRTFTNNPGGGTTAVDQITNSQTSETLGGTGSVINRAGAAIGGSVNVSGVRGATLDNAGSIGGNVLLSSSGARQDTTGSDRITTTRVPAVGGFTVTTVRDVSNTSASRATGGAVTGTYGGTVGIANPTNFNGSRTVQQNGTTGSSALVTGTLFANFSGTAGGQDRDTSNTFTSREVTQPNGSGTRDQSITSSETVTQIASTSSLTVAAGGRIANNGNNTGGAVVNSLGGNANLTVDGRIDGSVDVTAGTGINTVQRSNSSSTFTRAADVRGFPSPEVQQTQTNNSSSEQRAAAGTASATINSGGSVGGELFVSGTGTGAGSLAASALVNGNVAGGLTVRANRVDTTTTSSDVRTRTGPNAVSRTLTTSTLTTPAANSGNILVNVNGTVGGLVDAAAGSGSATVNIAGRAGSATTGGVFVDAFAFRRQSDTVQNSTGASFFSTLLTGSRTTTTTTATGGVATLNIAANADLSAAGASSVEGDISVRGFAGSVLNVAAGSRVNQTAGGVFVGAIFGNTVVTSDATFTNGVQTGSTSTNVSTITGGPATVNNAGIIGSSINSALVSVSSIAAANLNNSGTINGSVETLARSANSVTTTTSTGLNTADARTVSTRVTTGVGGQARVENSGLITGNVLSIAATGLVNNSGVIRGGVTLGGGVANFSTTTTTTSAGTVVSPSVANAALFNQNYTLNQNGLLLGGVNVTGTTTTDPSGATVRTSDVNAIVNLNSGSITLGNITADANTVADVNLNGSGFLGIASNDAPAGPVLGIRATGFQLTPSTARFAGIDSSLGTTTALPTGSRVTGVRNLTKTGDGAFVIVGVPLVIDNLTSTPVYTLDVGALRINGGELQLGTAGNAGVFGMRGNVENNAGLVLGRRIVAGTQTAIQGVNMSVLGNFTNAAAGTLFVGANPAFVRNSASSPFTPFVLGSPFLASSNSFVRVDGNLTLAGNLNVQAIPGGLYEAGRVYDLFSVSGAYANTGTVGSNFASPFVSFVLTPRTEGGRTVVSLNVARANFDTVATDRNARNAAGALQAALPGIFGGLRTPGGGGAFNQDFANIVAALDTQFTREQAGQVFRELSSGEFYGSLSALRTTAPFGEATDGLPTGETASGIGIWFRPTGEFAKFKPNDAAGASEVDANNYGASLGLNFATGKGSHVGIAGGYGKIDAMAETSPEDAEAETYMVGIYGAGQFGRLNLSAQAVYGKTEWEATRVLPTLARIATAKFDSEEFRANLRIAFTVAVLPGFDFSPFAKVEARRYDFDGFEEAGAGAVSLVVGKRAKTVVTPEAGFRISGSATASFRPFAEASYVFQEDVGSDRQQSFIGNRPGIFRVDGVNPRDSIKGAIGVAADVGTGTVFLRGDYRSGGDQQVGSVRGGLLFSF